jgi:hypothetical protein
MTAMGHELQYGDVRDEFRSTSDSGKTAAWQDRVAGLFDNLALRPSNPPDLPTRVRWTEKELRCTGWEWGTPKRRRFWKAILVEMSVESHGCREDQRPNSCMSASPTCATAR